MMEKPAYLGKAPAAERGLAPFDGLPEPPGLAGRLKTAAPFWVA